EQMRGLSESIRNSLSIVASKVPMGQTPVYKIQYRDRDKKVCLVVLTALLDSYTEYMNERHQDGSKDTIELIMREKRDLENKIKQHDTDYQAFREKAPLLGKAKDGLELRQERLQTIQAKRSALLLQRLDLEGQIAALETAKKENR